MKVSVTEAKGQLTELVRRAEAGDEVILTRHGHPAVRFVAMRKAPDRQSRSALLDAVLEAEDDLLVRGVQCRRIRGFAASSLARLRSAR